MVYGLRGNLNLNINISERWSVCKVGQVYAEGLSSDDADFEDLGRNADLYIFYQDDRQNWAFVYFSLVLTVTVCLLPCYAIMLLHEVCYAMLLLYRNSVFLWSMDFLSRSHLSTQPTKRASVGCGCWRFIHLSALSLSTFRYLPTYLLRYAVELT